MSAVLHMSQNNGKHTFAVDPFGIEVCVGILVESFVVGGAQVLDLEQAVTAPAAGGVSAVFADLNRGEEVTKHLRKVDKSEMTHKNPALRAGNTVPSSVGQGSSGESRGVASKHSQVG